MQLYVALEGLDGAGKTTIARLLGNSLTSRGVSNRVFACNWIGRGRLGRITSDICFYTGHNPIACLLCRCMPLKLALFSMNTLMNFREQKRLPPVEVLIGDRSILTYYAMFARCLGPRALGSRIQRVIIPRRMPDHLILLDIDPEQAMDRLKARGELFDNETPENLRMMQEEYRRVFSGKDRLPLPTFDIVDARRDISAVFHEVDEILSRVIERRSWKLEPISTRAA